MLSNFRLQTHVVTCIADRQLSGVAPAKLGRHYLKTNLQLKKCWIIHQRARQQAVAQNIKFFEKTVWSHRGGRSVSRICWQRFTQIWTESRPKSLKLFWFWPQKLPENHVWKFDDKLCSLKLKCQHFRLCGRSYPYWSNGMYTTMVHPVQTANTDHNWYHSSANMGNYGINLAGGSTASSSMGTLPCMLPIAILVRGVKPDRNYDTSGCNIGIMWLRVMSFHALLQLEKKILPFKFAQIF